MVFYKISRGCGPLLLGFAMCFGLMGLANAVPVAKQGDDKVTLLEQACPASIQAIVDSRGVPKEWTQHLGVATINGRLFQLCWTALPDGRVGIVYEDGDMGAIPIQAFHDEPGA